MQFPMPNDTLDYEQRNCSLTVIASAYVTDSSVAVIGLLPVSPFYVVVEYDLNIGKLTRATAHDNIVYATEDYHETTGCV